MLNEDYRDILQIFSEEKIKFIVVGAYALGVHGIPRATGDIDIFVKPDKENSNKIYNALLRFGAPVAEISPDDFKDEGVIFQIGVVPRRIDIITSIDGIDFNDTYSDNLMTDVDGIIVPILSARALIKNKEAAGRDKDLLDVKLLKKYLKLS